MLKKMLMGIGVFVSMTQASYAKPPVFVEMFGMNGCGADMKVQDAVFSMLREHDNVIFINCRKKFDDENMSKKYTHQFCNDRSAEYARRQSFWGERVPMVIINGQWEAFYDDLDPAIKMGRTDEVKPISVRVESNVIYVSVPEIENVKSGNLFLYAFAPTQGDETMVVDPDVNLTDDIQERLAAGQSVPFVTKERLVPYFVRPIVSREKIAIWDGRAMDASFSLDSLTELVGSGYQDLSYVVALHKGDDYGAVVAVGEVLSVAEQNNVLLHSKPLDIELRSNPNPEVLAQ
ncbi:MAG: hypothetical protein ACRBDI_05610 [Alphaproteobacteria bacterium]